MALGAAIAYPGRKVVHLQADGSGMYTVQALWTMAREKTDIVVVLLKNDAYAILGLEMARVREGEPNARMKSILELGGPTLDWVKIATGHGVPATRATTAEEFHGQFEAALSAKGRISSSARSSRRKSGARSRNTFTATAEDWFVFVWPAQLYWRQFQSRRRLPVRPRTYAAPPPRSRSL